MSYNFHAKTLKGFENLLAAELREIGAEEIQPVNRGVNFSGSISMMYKANYCLRTALRILRPLVNFRAAAEGDLYKQIRRIDWSEYMTVKHSFAIDATTFSKVFRNSHYVELKVKDAIADQFREKTTLRPSVDINNPDIRINVHIQENWVTVSLDSSGESLHKRGYRKSTHPAALSEVLAAGLVLMTGWDQSRPLVNPMCGSGTIAIEAAMIAGGIFPGSLGRKYAFENWPDHDPVLYKRLVESLPAPKEANAKIIASDIDPSSVRITKNNIRQAGLSEQVQVTREDFLQPVDPVIKPLIIMNPPYGERMVVDEIETFYGQIGTVLKHRYEGAEVWIFTANASAAQKIALKPGKKYNLFNASLPCQYLQYSMFSGSRKSHISS